MSEAGNGITSLERVELHPSYNLRVSDFFFGATVGAGSFGHVCYARRKRPANATGCPFTNAVNTISEEYAIKIMDKHQILKEKKLQAVMMEKDILLHYAIQQENSSCDSRNSCIIRLYGAFHDSQHLFLLLELCWGTLSDIVPFTYRHYHLDDRNHPCNSSIASAHVFYYFGQIVRALEYLHSNGIIHCDLKPDNILITQHGQIRLSDFGAAVDMKKISFTTLKSSSDALTYQQPMVGSIEYVSPEMIRGEFFLTPSADLWALGCILW
jgi:3-phosphoinositide dependent protein kinase-1